MAPMAFCRDLTSAAGPVIRDVPVSTMASQPPLQRLSWLPTAILTDKPAHVSVSKQQSRRDHLNADGAAFQDSPVHVDLPVGLAGDVDVLEVAGVVLRVGSSQQQLAAGLSVRVPDTMGTFVLFERRGSRKV